MPESPLLRLPRAVRLLVVPAILLVFVSATAFALAQWHPAKRATPATASDGVALGDATAGERLFAANCASCHGDGGAGGGVGPTLAGSTISLAAAKATIDGGKGVMPGGLVTGTQEEDVLAYLATILGTGPPP